MSERPSYNPHRSCPKCGHGIVSSKHVTFAFGTGEAIRRRCDRCDFVWDEDPLDDRLKTAGQQRADDVREIMERGTLHGETIE